jgi:hypothetical protein
MLCKCRLEICFERLAVLLYKVEWCRNVKVMLEVCNVQQNRVAIVGHAEQLDARTSALKCAFFSINLLKGESVGLVVEVV